jgi:hypothetical protein
MGMSGLETVVITCGAWGLAEGLGRTIGWFRERAG